MTTFHHTHGDTAAPPHTGFLDRTLIRALLGTSALVLALAAWPAAAAPTTTPKTAADTTDLAQSSKTTAFDIPAQALPTALNAFGRQAGVQVTVDAALTQGRQAPAVTGEMTAAEALDRLLTGTGITWTFSDPKTVALSRPSASGERITLGTVAVEGRGIPRQSEIGNQFPEYAGGQVATGGKLGILGGRGVMDTPFNHTSYTSQLMQNQQSQRISDALKNDPTVNVINSASSGLDYFAIRGFGVNGSDILFNGLPGVGPTNFNSMLSESIERVEVIKGPSALLNGIGRTGSVGGAINLVPKRAGDTPLTQVTPSYTGTSQFGGHIDVSRRFGDNQAFGARLNGVYRDGDSAIDNLSMESRLTALSLDYQGDQFRAAIDAGYQYQDLQGTRRFASVSAGVDAPAAPENTTNFFDPFEFKTSDDFYGVGQVEYDIAESLTGFLQLGASHQEYTDIRSNRTISNSDGDLSTGNAFVEAAQELRLTTELGLRGKFKTGLIDHQATAAFSWFELESHSKSVTNAFVASNIYAPTYGSAPSISLAGDPDDAPLTGEQSASSLSLGDTLTFLDDKVQFTFGVRYQRVSAKFYNSTTGAVSSSYREDAISPMYGLVLKPRNDVSLYANFIEGLQRGSTAPSGTANAGEVMAPYVTKQYEMGAKWDLGRVITTLALFQVALPSAVTDPATNTYGINGEQRHRGIDFNVFGEVADGIRLLGGVSVIDSELTKTAGGTNNGNTGIGTSGVRTVIGGEWDMPFLQGLTLTGRFSYTGSVYLNAANSSKAPNWTQVDIGARYTIDRPGGNPVVIRANIDNIFDADYWNANAFGQMSLSDPLTVKLSASFDF